MTCGMVDGFGLPLEEQCQHRGQSPYHLMSGIHQIPHPSVCPQTLQRERECERERERETVRQRQRDKEE